MGRISDSSYQVVIGLGAEAAGFLYPGSPEIDFPGDLIRVSQDGEIGG